MITAARCVMQLTLTFRATLRRLDRYDRSMTVAAARLLTEALALPEAQRAELAEELLASLAPAAQAEARGEDEGTTEIERRSRAALVDAPALPGKKRRPRSCRAS